MLDSWLKALHVAAVISWMAGLFYLPRLFVYHVGTMPGSETSETFKVMERRLYRFIMRPAMLVTWLVGLWLAWSSFGFQGGWLHAKIALVTMMSGHHALQGRWLRELAEDRRGRSARFFRIQNEVPTLLMLAILVLVIVRPF